MLIGNRARWRQLYWFCVPSGTHNRFAPVASRAQTYPLSPSLPFFLPSPSSRPLFSLLSPPLLLPPDPSSPSSLPSPLLPLPLTLSAPSLLITLGLGIN